MAKERRDEKTVNQGEGDKRSARRFNEAEQAFVQSEEGRDAIAQVGQEDEATQREDRAAEQAARARAKAEDPAVTRKPGTGKARD
ncbi:MAG: hypothetical protein AB7I01_21175 [Gammaproteobacteria bacterium]